MNFADFIDLIIIQGVIDPLIILVFALALVYFLWGVSRYIWHGGDEAKRTEGYQMMIYGVIALFVMVSVWSLVAILENTFLGGSGGGFFDININIGF